MGRELSASMFMTVSVLMTVTPQIFACNYMMGVIAREMTEGKVMRLRDCDIKCAKVQRGIVKGLAVASSLAPRYLCRHHLAMWQVFLFTALFNYV